MAFDKQNITTELEQKPGSWNKHLYFIGKSWICIVDMIITLVESITVRKIGKIYMQLSVYIAKSNIEIETNYFFINSMIHKICSKKLSHVVNACWF